MNRSHELTAYRKSTLTATVLLLASWLAVQATAGTFTTLHQFDNYYAEGSNPHAGLVLSGNVLYGAAKYEGSFRSGVVFAVSTDGGSFTNLHNFVGFPSEGGFPESELVVSGDVLFGTSGEGTTGAGTVFKINPDGTGFQTLHSFAPNTDGAAPLAGLVLSGNTLYGTAAYGGNFYGTVFRLNTDGTAFTNLHTFSMLSGPGTNVDGVHPLGRLVLSDNTLYGTASEGGAYGGGTVFALTTNGSGFRTLYHFTAMSGSSHQTNSDGGNPQAGLVISGNTLYGTAVYGGSSGNGTVFALSTDGTAFTNLHTFEEAIGSGPYYTNSEGVFPKSELVLSGNTLYGTAYGGGGSGVGTVFCVNTNGTGFEVLHSFSGLDGENPDAGLLLSGYTLYGTTAFGGRAHGTVFSMSFEPQLSIVASAMNVVLTWPTNVAGFDYSGYVLESATNLGSPTWNPVPSRPLVVDGQNTVTNSIAETQQFFRLRE